MKQQVVILFVLLFQLGLSAQEGLNSRKWQLAWEDNFDFVDTSIWEVKNYFDHYGGAAVYTTENVSTKDGKLVIAIKTGAYSCPDWAVEPNWLCVRQYKTGAPYKYTSGWIESKSKYDTQYGLIEARIRFPYQEAFWPAFWTFKGESKKDPVNAAEIDIAEQLGELGSKTVTTNIHLDYCTQDKASYSQGCPEIKDYFQKHTPKKYDWENDHVYGVEWTPKKMNFYVDGKKTRTIKKHGIEDPVRLILSLGLRPDVEVNDSLLPQEMLVDYVKVYKQIK